MNRDVITTTDPAEIELKLAKLNIDLSKVHSQLAGAELRAQLGWQRYEAANKRAITNEMLLEKAVSKLHEMGIKWPN